MKKKTVKRHNLEIAINAYLVEFLKRMEWDSTYGYWIGDDCLDLYAYGDEYYFALHDIVFCVDNNVDKETMIEWHDYRIWAHSYDQASPNLQSWVNGCPRASKEEMERIEELERNFNQSISDLKSKY